jgi:peptide/nickel transport system ATP-binding protein
MILNVAQLSVRFYSERGVFPAVRGLSFSMERGESLGIVGESGSGKSLTALSLMRLTDYLPGCSMEAAAMRYFPEGGEPLDILQLSREDLRKVRGKEIAMVFQDPGAALNPVFTCGRQIEEVLRAHQGMQGRTAREAALGWLERVQLPDVKRMYASYPHQLSGGQKQRVAIAAALAGEPDLLIADEPTSSLDARVQGRILDLLRQLRAELGMSLLFISHDLGVVAEMADRVLVMQGGEAVEEGAVERVFKAPSHPYTRRLLASRPPKDGGGKPKSDFSDLPPLLEVEDLSVRYELPRASLFGKRKYLQAVDGVDLRIAPGETLGLVGDSGCGKTSLGKAIIGLVAAHGGAIRMEGRAQIVFQDPYLSLNPRMRIGETLVEPLKVHRIGGDKAARRELALHWLERVGLDPDHFSRFPNELSGGQRQRVGIARALSVSPRLLVCDECVSALDVTIQAQVLDLLMELQREQGFAMLFISHDMDVVRFISDRVLEMENGKIL